MIKLILKFNGALVKELTVVGSDIFVGRKPENDLVIDNPAVSGKHCRIFWEGAGYFVEDLKSTNGTFLRERRVERELLHHKDELAIAKHTLEFYNDEEVPPSSRAEPAGPVSSDSTVIMAAPPPAVKGTERVGYLRILAGSNAVPLPLTQLTTYIGKSDQAQVKLKGLFAPDLAACVAKKSDGYYLTALKEKTVKLNGNPLMDQAVVPLKEGDLVDAAGLKLMFFLQEANPK
ncbi:MAG: FHA domain-containing protein [Elusimicrobia bacterium]|jgi:pSer/pThr/pTyr-binding forkhead associated (FHA) protein|nr:FHA domain-containing protein [Elusimicrobiota bacterium]